MMMYAPNELAKLQYTMTAQTTATLLTPGNFAILSAQDKSTDGSSDAVTMVNGAVSNVASQSAVNANSITVFTSDVHQYNDLQYKCMWSQCAAMFQSLDDLVSHVNHLHIKVEADEMYRCHWEGCPRHGKGFNARYKILIHLRTHTNEKPHGCFCGKQFSRLENLKIHKRTHTGEKPYGCPYQGCNKAYSNSSDRFKHVLTHRTDRPYCCKMPGCSKRYTDPSSLRKHIRAHGHHIRANNVKVEGAEQTLSISHSPVTAPDRVSGITAPNSVMSSVAQDEQISPTKIPHLPYAVAGLPALINGAFYIPTLIPNTLLPLASVPLTDGSLKVLNFEGKKASSISILARDKSPGALL